MTIKDLAFHPLRRRLKGFATAFARRCEFVASDVASRRLSFWRNRFHRGCVRYVRALARSPIQYVLSHRSMTKKLR